MERVLGVTIWVATCVMCYVVGKRVAATVLVGRVTRRAATLVHASEALSAKEQRAVFWALGEVGKGIHRPDLDVEILEEYEEGP